MHYVELLKRHKNYLLAALLGAGIWFGISTRVINFGSPATVGIFDENIFIKAATGYLTGSFQYQDHPPVGHFGIALGTLLFGENGFGWRSISVAVGLLVLVLSAYFAYRLFNSRLAAGLAGYFIAVDGLFIILSRLAYLDIFLACLTLAAATSAYLARRMRHFILISGSLFGLAVATKYYAAFLLPALLYLVWQRRWWKSVPFFLVWALFVYAIVIVSAQFLGQAEHPIQAAWEWQKLSLGYHQTADGGLGDYGSRWYTWPFVARPLFIEGGQVVMAEQMVLARAFMPNPLLAWVSALVGVVATIVIVARLLPGKYSRQSTGYIFLLTAYWSLLASWAFVGRGTAIYHYLLAYMFLLIFLAGTSALAWRKYPLVVLTGLLLVFLSAAWFAPLWSGEPQSSASFKNRLLLPSWREALTRVMPEGVKGQ